MLSMLMNTKHFHRKNIFPINVLSMNVLALVLPLVVLFLRLLSSMQPLVVLLLSMLPLVVLMDPLGVLLVVQPLVLLMQLLEVLMQPLVVLLSTAAREWRRKAGVTGWLAVLRWRRVCCIVLYLLLSCLQIYPTLSPRNRNKLIIQL
jgi:hypothetical protein